MNRLIIEVSQLVKWPGKMTGIPRTMSELSYRFMAHEALFVRWDPEKKEFYQIDFTDSMAQRELLGAEVTAEQPGKLKRLVRRMKQRSRAVTRAVEYAKALRRLAREQHEDSTPFAMEKGDVLFIAWGEAHDTVLTDRLVSLHDDTGVQLVHISHDMIPIVTPQFAGHTTEALRDYASQIYPRCSLIFANSKNTYNDLVAWFDSIRTAPPSIEIMRLGDDFDFADAKRPVEDAFAKSKLKGDDYILCVGTIEARKNHTILYYVYKLAQQRGIDLPKIVIVGRRGWRTDDIYHIMTEDPEVKDSFVFLHNCSDEELSWLYDHCLFSLYVSFYEGWGLPIAESIGRRVPCIASNTSSMLEAADGLASVYVSPASPDEILDAIHLLMDPKERQKAIKKAESYQPYSWDNSFDFIYKKIGEIHE